ncbi:hypothetical protein C2I18_17520 [Paenibacillus sp. PK3_47]|uniref:DUF4367 domain-containing protein n=1 Tax=Paenibacillus sp. PK3_47 TaxID=2072642 RepID=UPI00201E701C|nr:DUF4367 domain-containing protein [Paenibacillus sp. PK3_47]UQZ35165.1 hypothetical protein C2I18_17520 [Paenibacillus sp. PK3_47]
MNPKEKNTIQNFAHDIDNSRYTDVTGNRKKSPEYEELLKLGQALAEHDFSRDSSRSTVLVKARNGFSRDHANRGMQLTRRLKRPAMILASLLIAGIVSAGFVKPSFAQEMLQKINLGHIIASVMDYTRNAPEFPEELRGKIFDRYGNPVESYLTPAGALFTASGEPIANITWDNQIITKKEQEALDKELEAKKFNVKSLAEMKQYALFDVKLPQYLPEGFVFDRGEFYKGEEGVNGNYLNLYFSSEKKGKRISIFLAYANEDNAYEMSTSGKMEQVKVNGTDAVMMNERSLDWEADGVLYGLSTRGLDRDEVLRIAESIR